MLIKKIFFTTIIVALAMPVSAQSANWNVLVDQAREASKNGDVHYALYKLRKAWFAIPDKNLNSEPHAHVKSALIEVMKLHKSRYVQSESKRMQQYSMEEIDSMLKQREFNASGDQYNVEMQKDGTLLFSMNGLDRPFSGEPICLNYVRNLTDEERPKFHADVKRRAVQLQKSHESWQAEMRSRMPIIYKPESPKYIELLSLCQPIQPGEKKQKTGFDVSPFLPSDLPRTPDI